MGVTRRRVKQEKETAEKLAAKLDSSAMDLVYPRWEKPDYVRIAADVRLTASRIERLAEEE